MTQHTYMPQSTEDTTLATPPLSDAPQAFTPERNIPADIARSWLLVNAMKTELFDQSAVSRADAIILDIEDAVDPSQKDAARANVVDWLTAGGSAWVRINDATSPFWADDLAGLRGTPGLLGVMLAKTESADQVTESFHRMDGKTPVIPLVESAARHRGSQPHRQSPGRVPPGLRLGRLPPRHRHGGHPGGHGLPARQAGGRQPRRRAAGPHRRPHRRHEPPDPARADRHHRDDGHDRQALPRDRPDPGHQ